MSSTPTLFIADSGKSDKRTIDKRRSFAHNKYNMVFYPCDAVFEIRKKSKKQQPFFRCVRIKICKGKILPKR